MRVNDLDLAALRRAITMEALLVWALQVQRADIGSQAAGRVGPADFTGRVSGDGAFACLAQGVLGAKVDCVGSWRQDRGTWLHPDAEAVYSAARALPIPTNFLVIDHARSGTRPGWRPYLKPVEVEAELVRRRGHLVGKIHHTRPAKGPQLPYCKVFYGDRRREISYCQGVYHAWWCALRDLAGQLSGGATLKDWAITGIGAEARPWEKNA